MKKLLITGASGFLGSRIVDFYTESYEILAPSHHELDITDAQHVSCYFLHHRPDCVVHCAAVSDVSLCEKEPERSWKINVEGSFNLANAAKESGVVCLLCSSDQVYFGSRQKGARREEEVLSPVNRYGQEKLTAEQECLKANPHCIFLRLSWMYDVQTKRPDEHGDFFRTLLFSLKNGEPLRLPIYDRRGITDVTEVVQNLEKAFFLPGGVYNFGSPNEADTYTTLTEVFTAVGLDTTRLQKNAEAFCKDPRNICMCQDKIQSYGITFTSTVDNLSKNMIHHL